MKTKHSRLVIMLIFAVIGMFGFGFALVPIYNSLCKTLGINGKVDLTKRASTRGLKLDQERMITVEFVATQNSTVPWNFYPTVKKVKIHPGEMYRLSFYAENKTDHKMIVQAIPSITPGIAAKYLKKTECFCFAQQTLNGHEAMYMPLLFHVDADLPKNVNTITLAYTLFDITDRL
ncbi:MAG: cytochrome c oxidase assembly protein [Gammaproteobacteria bacterium]|nr:cytochrome c oxidase assembly protein [Gammaproteobacteria bacterium]